MQPDAQNNDRPNTLPRLIREGAFGSPLAEEPKADDPRFKSPDELLSRIAPIKAPPPLRVEITPKPEAPLKIEAPSKGDAEPKADTDAKLEAVSKELVELRQKYGREISQWKEYERRMKEWSKQVSMMFHSLKREAAAKNDLAKEVQRCKTLLQTKEEELARLKALLDDPNSNQRKKYFNIFH
jgi:hypothetical protein